MENQEFKIGDIVTKPAGKKPFELTYVPAPGQASRWNPYKGTYLDSGSPAQSEKVVHYFKDSMNNKTIYTFTDEQGEKVVGMYIGTNSKGMYMLEVDDGRDEYVIKDPGEVEEVVPFTFSVDIQGKEIHYIGEPGKIEQGDFLLHRGSRGSFDIVQVKKIDTKSKQARPKFNGLRLLTENIF
jgi:hypothetical protein